MSEKRIQFSKYEPKDKIIEEGAEIDFDEGSIGEDGPLTFAIPLPNGGRNVPSEYLNPFKEFDFWKCQTNFNVTPNILKLVEKVDGVEILLPLTRYSFLFAVAKMFHHEDVQDELKKVILNKNMVV
jgi:hypothetical protein